MTNANEKLRTAIMAAKAASPADCLQKRSVKPSSKTLIKQAAKRRKPK